MESKIEGNKVKRLKNKPNVKENTRMSKKKASKKKNSKGSKKANLVSKVMIKIAMYTVAVLVLVWLCKVAFNFGVKLFSEEGMARDGEGVEVVVTIPVDSSTGEVASILKENGLIDSEFVFKLQASIYEAEINPGTYTLNTEFGPEEIIDALRINEEE